MLKQKLLWTILASAVVLTLAGCRQAGYESPEKTPTISVYGGGIGPIGDVSPVKEELEKKLGIKLEYIDSTWETRHTKLDVMISSGKTPDLFTYGYIQGDKVNRLIQQDIIMELTPCIESYPEIKKRMEAFSVITQYGKEKNYFIPVKSTDTEASVVCEHAWFYRKDIIEQIGVPLPQNVEEFYEFLKAIQEYQQKNGMNSASPLTLQNQYFLYSIYDLFDTNLKGVENINGTFQPAAVGEKMKQAVLFVRKLYEEGLLDREFMLTPDWEFMFDKFLNGKSPVIYTNYKYDKMTELCRQAYPQKDPAEMIAYMPVLYNTSGQKKVSGVYNYFGGLFFKKEADSTKARKKLELIDYMMSEEGMRLLRYGIEGVHYKMENDVPVSILQSDFNGVPKRIENIDPSASIKSLVMYDVLFLDGQSKYREYITQMRDEYLQYAVVDNAFVYGIPAEQLTIDPVVLEEFAETSMVSLIAEEKDFDAAWDEYCRRYMEKGGTQLAAYAEKYLVN